MFVIGKAKIVLKPATFVLLAAIVAVIFLPSYLMRQAARTDLVWKHSNLDIWKFEMHRGAEAVLLNSGSPEQQKSGSASSYHIDLNKGIEADILKRVGAADCVDLRNAINFEEIKNKDNLVLRFSARSDRPHDLVMILRESDQLRWSTKKPMKNEWQDFSVSISFKPCITYQAIFSIHLGGETGKIALKNLRIEER